MQFLEQPPILDSSAEKFSYKLEKVASEDFGTPKKGLKRAQEIKLSQLIGTEMASSSEKKPNILLKTEESPGKKSSVVKSFIRESLKRIQDSSKKKK